MNKRTLRFARTARAAAVGLTVPLLLSGTILAGARDSTAEPPAPASAATPPPGGTAALSAPTLEGVMRRLAESGGVAARFSESRKLAILEAPIESSGWLYFSPPDSLARHVESPGQSRVIVRDDRVSFRDETGVQTLELASSEVARAMVGNVMLLMRGDLEALQKQYEVRFRADNDAWTLDLEPRDKLLRAIIERLRVEGADNRLVRMQTIETSGDETSTRFSDVRVGVDFSDVEREQIFSVDTSAGSAADARETAGREGAR